MGKNSMHNGEVTIIVSFSDAVQRSFQQYFTFRGRSTRAEFWWFFLFAFIGATLLSLVDMMMGTYSTESGNGLFSGLFRLGILIPGLALGARRLHDINRTGWWQLLWFAVVPGIILLVWAAKQGDDVPNKYG